MSGHPRGITSAQDLIDIFEQSPPDFAVRKEVVADMAERLGGSRKAVINCRWDTSILAYVLALAIRRLEENSSAAE